MICRYKQCITNSAIKSHRHKSPLWNLCHMWGLFCLGFFFSSSVTAAVVVSVCLALYSLQNVRKFKQFLDFVNEWVDRRWKKNYKHAYKLIEKKKWKPWKLYALTNHIIFTLVVIFNSPFTHSVSWSLVRFQCRGCANFFCFIKCYSGGFTFFFSLYWLLWLSLLFLLFIIYMRVLMTFIFVYWMANWFTCSNSIRTHTQSTNLSRLIKPFQLDAKDEMGMNDWAKDEMKK